VAIVTVVVGLGIAVTGNLVVAGAIWQTPYGDAEVSALSLPGLEPGHALEGRGEAVAWFAGLAFALLVGLLRKVSWPVAAGGLVLGLPPPWMISGAGVVFVLAYLLASQHPVRSQAAGSATGSA
jgi:hypothetical protein